MDQNYLEIWKAFRSYEEHENAPINHRTSWFITMQSVLIATFGFSIQKYFEVMAKLSEITDPKSTLERMSNINSKYQTYLFILCIIVTAVAFWAHKGIGTAITAQVKMRELFTQSHKAKADEYKLPDISGGGDIDARNQGGTFAMSLPIAAGAFWILVAMGTLLSISGVSMKI